MHAVTKGFVSRHVLTPYRAAVGSQPDLLSWTDPPPKYSEKPTTNELLSLLDPLSASSNQLPSTGLAESDVLQHSYVSCLSGAGDGGSSSSSSSSK